MDSVKFDSPVNNLIAGDFPTVMDAVTVAANQELTRGTVLGIVTASGEAVPCDTALANGAETPHAILAEDVDTATDSATAPAPVFFTGEFRTDGITLGGSTTAADVKAALRSKSIFLK